MYTLLSNKHLVPFIGVYSTPEHPFALVFEFMEHLNLREYLRNNRDVGKLELVRFHPRFFLLPVSVPRYQLLGIARAMKDMHSLNVIHGNLETVRTFLCVHFDRAHICPD